MGKKALQAIAWQPLKNSGIRWPALQMAFFLADTAYIVSFYGKTVWICQASVKDRRSYKEALMKKHMFLSSLCVLAALCAAPAWAADASHAAFLDAARNFVDGHILPDGDAIGKDDLTGNFSENGLAVCDVNGDGKAELLVRFQSGTEASKQEYVCGYDEKTGKVTVKFSGVPGAEYFSNGCIKQYFSHNQGLGGEFWPYSFSTYDAKKGEYDMKGSVDACSRKAFPTNPF